MTLLDEVLCFQRVYFTPHFDTSEGVSEIRKLVDYAMEMEDRDK